MFKIPNLFFVFDVESIGLHGGAFAVAGGVYNREGAAQWEFSFACPREYVEGMAADREWVNANVPVLETTHINPATMAQAFWEKWEQAKSQGAVMAAECSWPVEGRFLNFCISQNMADRNFKGPYPLHEIASFMVAAGMDPMKEYPRSESELPKHNPLADARQSARILAIAIQILKENNLCTP